MSTTELTTVAQIRVIITEHGVTTLNFEGNATTTHDQGEDRDAFRELALARIHDLARCAMEKSTGIDVGGMA